MPQVKKDRTGEVYILKNNIEATIINYRGAKDIDVMLNNGEFISNITVANLLNGFVANPLEKSVLGIGYLGNNRNKKLRKKAYITWLSMIKRCYGGTEINYADCTVDEEWHNFSNFMEWYVNNYFEGCCVDKDLKIKGNRIYSSDTCILVPKFINNIIITNKSNRRNLIGVVNSYNKFSAYLGNVYLGIFETEIEAFKCYKKHKEESIKEIALLYYSNGLITTECYEALNKWTIDIND